MKPEHFAEWARRRRNLTPREIKILEARARKVTVKALAQEHGVAQWRIRAVADRAKAKIVEKIITRLVTPE